jgi:hypothetical protein
MQISCVLTYPHPPYLPTEQQLESMIFVIQYWWIYLQHNLTSSDIVQQLRIVQYVSEVESAALLLTYLLTYLLIPWTSPSWEPNRFSASQIPCILWKPKVHYRIHKWPPLVPIPSERDSVHTHTSYFLKILLNIILPSMPGSPKLSLSFRLPNQNLAYASPLPHTCYMPHPFHFRKGGVPLLTL